MSQKDVTIVLQPMTVDKLAQELGQPVNVLILALLKEGIVAAKNQILPESVVIQAAKLYGVQVVKPSKPEEKAVQDGGSAVESSTTSRLPIVVVVGHVDHGKTTLLDFIRKTRVASREKGGITQHLGAYKATTDHGDLVFLDTPGHEAFSMMRARGITVADIAILIVAAEDGIMPQTAEAIDRAKAAGLPIVVAINKVDKATDKQIEAVKSALSKYELIPEDWGGQTVCVPISALTGQGVNELLEVVVLQSQVMELTAALDVPASGYVLESHLERGRGPVATVICQQGILRVGDSFACGSTRGRVSTLKTSAGKLVKSIEPSHPVQVAGFESLAQAGDFFKVGSARDVKRGKLATEERPQQRPSQVLKKGSLNIIVKTDTASSGEALLSSIQKISEKTYRSVYVVSSGIGSISESDVALAESTGSVLYGMHTKIEPSASALAQKMGIKVKLFDIIYKLLEELEESGEVGRPIKMKTEKTGEAVVLKVFDIKKLGIVAGAHVVDGYCSREGTVVVYRGNQRIGAGKFTSLQKDKKSVKQARKGFECAFMVDKFDGWQVDDRVECFLEVPA